MDISEKTLFLEAFDAVIKHLIKFFESRKSQLSNLSRVHAMWIIVSFLATTPAVYNNSNQVQANYKMPYIKSSKEKEN